MYLSTNPSKKVTKKRHYTERLVHGTASTFFTVKNKEVSWTKELKASIGRPREGAKMVDTKGECWWLITALTKQPGTLLR